MEKVIAITGGAQGIGKSVAIDFLKSGWYVAVIDIDSEAIEEIQEENKIYANRFLAFEGDVSREEDIKKWLDEIVKNSIHIKVLVNNAAISINKPLEELSYQEWKRVIDVNLSSVFLTAKYFSLYLKKEKGCIVNIASTRAFQSEPNTEAYSASKGGIVSLTHALAISLGPEVRVNSISPGWIETESLKKSSRRKAVELRPEDHLQHPCGRVGVAEDIVSAIKFLVDEKNSFITGTNIIIDGGMTKKMIYLE
ncbi:MAG: SDR family oxidoreductase [Brevinematia bacterium]